MAHRFIHLASVLFLALSTVIISARVVPGQDAKPRNGKYGEVALFKHRAPVLCLAVSRDGKLAITGGGGILSADYALRLWDVKTGRELRRFEGHESVVYDVAISNDDATALSTGEDGSLRVWDVKTGKQRRLIAAHQLPTETVCLTPDGGHAVTGCIDGTVKVWDIRTGKEISRLRPKNPADQFIPTRTVVLADGLRAVTGCDKGWIYLWELKTAGRLHHKPLP